MKTKHEKIVEEIANELIGVIPIHKGTFISQEGARRCANHDNTYRFDVADRIATAIEQLEPEGEVEFDCPECGERIQYGLSKATLERIKQSKLFTPQQPSDSETPIEEFRKHIANELTREELIDRLCETTQLYRDLREQWLNKLISG